MIFKKQPKVSKTLQKQRNSEDWKHRFKIQLYKINYKNINEVEQGIKKQKIRQNVGLNLIKNLRKYYQKYQQKCIKYSQQINHPFCVYIPLKKGIQFDDQIVNTFIYLRNLKDGNNLLQQDNFYTEIRKFLKCSKDNNKLAEGWNVCLNRFIVGLDLLQRISIYMYILKYGSQHLQQMHTRYAKLTLKDAFIERIMSVSKYFQKQVRLNKTWKISVQLNERINQANISKTMKMLYCSICLIYDCGKHKLEELSHKKDHHYCSPKNQIKKQIHLKKAIQLLKQSKYLMNNIKLKQNNYCSQNCYKKLNKKIYPQKQIIKNKLISPMISSLIKIGIQLYSYYPCKICYLFPKQFINHSKITCSIIFLYLLQQLNLQQTLNYKINSNQVQYLKKQYTNTINIQTIKKLNKTILPQKKAKNKSSKIKQYKYYQIATCFHSYIGQQIFDQNCQQCVCHLRGFCLPQCQCRSQCSLLIFGCLCKNKQDCQIDKCICYRTNIQCIPGICHNCFTDNGILKRNNCKNDQILRGMSKPIRIGKSEIPKAGFGAFANGKIKKGQLIQTYSGQIVDQEMQNIRQTIKIDQSFYNFACSQGSIDARFMGNKTRFVNHSNQYQNKTNLVSLNMFSCGQQFIGLYAIRDIQDGEQLLFDYDVQGEVAKTHSNIYEFLRKDAKIQNVNQ